MRIMRILYLFEMDVDHLQTCMLNNTHPPSLVKTKEFLYYRNLALSFCNFIAYAFPFNVVASPRIRWATILKLCLLNKS